MNRYIPPLLGLAATFAVAVWADTYSSLLTMAPPREDRIQTAADGTATATFATPFATGIVPRCSVDIENSAAADTLSAKIDGTPTNTQISVRVTRSQATVVGLIGLTVLAVPASVGAQSVHYICVEP